MIVNCHLFSLHQNRRGVTLTPSLSRCYSKTTNKRAKCQILKLSFFSSLLNLFFSAIEIIVVKMHAFESRRVGKYTVSVLARPCIKIHCLSAGPTVHQNTLSQCWPVPASKYTVSVLARPCIKIHCLSAGPSLHQNTLSQCWPVPASFSPEIVQAGAVKGLTERSETGSRTATACVHN